MTNYNERLDEIVRDAYSGEISWIYDQLDGTSFIGESLERVEKDIIDTKQAITSLTKELVAEAKRESHKSGYIQAIADFSGYYMDASIPAQRNLIMPHIAIELTENYKYPKNLLRALEEV